MLSLNFKIKSGYCGDTEIYTELVNNREANCARYASAAKNAYVPFVAGKDTFSIHSIISADGVVTEPVCTAEGYTTYKCTECGEDVIGNIVDALNHDLVHHDAKTPTCTEIGWDAYDTCSRCDYSTYVEKPALDHDLVHHDAKAPTCTEIGWDAYDTCSRCDYTTYVEKPALDHDFADEWAVDVEPTTSAPGQKSRHCSRCDEVTDIIEIPKLVEIVDSSKLFTDVQANAWYKEYIDYAVTYGLLNGKGNGKMEPESTITRAEFVQVLANLAGVDTSNKVVYTAFSDVKSGQWYAPAVKWAAENGIVNGMTADIFAPNEKITREQMCTMLIRFIENYKGITLEKKNDKKIFADDAEISSWAKDAVYKCQVGGLVSGVSATRFAPKSNANRASVATIMARFHRQYLR